MKNCGIVKNLLKWTSIIMSVTFKESDFENAQDRNHVDSLIDEIRGKTNITAIQYAGAIEKAKQSFKTRKAQNCAAEAKVTPAGPQTAKSVKIA